MTESSSFMPSRALRRLSASKSPMKWSIITQTEGITTPASRAFRSSGSRAVNPPPPAPRSSMPSKPARCAFENFSTRSSPSTMCSWTARCQVMSELQNDLEGLARRPVEEIKGFRRVGRGYDVRDQLGEVEPSGGREGHERALQSVLVPAMPQCRCDPGDLRHGDLDP